MFFSIVTINYNNCDGLRRTIDSVLRQDFHQYEWIIIDGGSTDESLGLINNNSEHFSYWCSEPDKGVYNAQNKGILKASGEYILILNSGDCLAHDKVLSQIHTYGSDYDFILGNMIVHQDGECYLWDIKPEMLTARQFFYGTLPHPGTFIKRTMFNKYGLYDESMKICADWKFFVDAILLGNASIIKVPVTISDFEGGGMSDKLLELSKQERSTILNKIFPPMVQKDYQMLESLLEVRRFWLFRKLYSGLYKMAILYQHLFHKDLAIGYNFHKI